MASVVVNSDSADVSREMETLLSFIVHYAKASPTNSLANFFAVINMKDGRLICVI